jgi:hypothetical protein
VLVYRDAIRGLTGAELRAELRARVQRCEENPGALPLEARQHTLAVLLIAAELETALEDLGHDGRLASRRFTDASASAWWTGEWERPRALSQLATLVLPDRLTLKRPEGYAYYALQPSAYAEAAIAIAASGPALVIGIRSIGTSASAVASAALRARACSVERLTLRPVGHPWDRTCPLRDEALARVRSRDWAACLVVDEGPGLSGSTFLAVGEALEAAGVPLDRITFVTSHDVDATRLVARSAKERWRRFRTFAVPDVTAASGTLRGAIDVSGGAWRAQVFRSPAQWPASWTSVERRKFRCPERGTLLKFAGLSVYGEAARSRAERLAEAGFGPPVMRWRGGYLEQRWCDGRVQSRPLGPLGPGFLEHLTRYLTFRSRAFPAPACDAAALEGMARQNVAEALGLELDGALSLDVVRPVYADARLLPHEWICAEGGRWIKVDAADHGDDHHFPGPCDVAWDLAGAIVELGLRGARADALLERYRRASGDDARARLPGYLVAYAAERVGRASLALAAAAPTERARLARDERRYRECLRRFTRMFFGGLARASPDPRG